MSKVLIIAEHNGSALNPSTSKTVSCAQSLKADSIEIVVFGHAVDTVAAQAAKLNGISRVLTCDQSENANPLAAVIAPQLAALANDGSYSYVFGPSTTFGKDLMPRVAALLGVGQISDIMEVVDAHTFKRPIYAGNAIATVKAPADKTIIATVRVASYRVVNDDGAATVEAATTNAQLPTHTRYVELKSETGDRPDLQIANVVVSGGRGVGSKENFELLYSLADSIGAGVGASRAAVDAGYVPNDMQVGQTGKIISPDLYLAFGISGAIQHLTGIKDAGTIVAVNKDPDAPIFEIADIGLVGDLFEVIPELGKQLGN
jgi:electron transfer flavoprotein alpha subunit